MDFVDKIGELSVRISKQLDNIKTEEATKHSLILPFISVLGYDVFDSSEVTPELVADVGIKKGEKVDYAILKDGKPVIIFECKHHSTNLPKEHASQLHRYFHVTPCKFGVLTNGLTYQFFTDLEEPNKMDEKPFFEFNILDIKENAVEELKKFTKSAFEITNILNTAEELKYTRAIRNLINEQITSPSEDFLRFIVGRVQGGKFTQANRERFAILTTKAFRQLLNEQINERLKSALTTEQGKENVQQGVNESDSIVAAGERNTESDTTNDELDGFLIVRAILYAVVSPSRVVMRDVQSYCGVLLDDNNRKPICRLYFNSTKKYLGLFDGDKEERVQIIDLNQIFEYGTRLKDTAVKYDVKSKGIPAV